MSSVKEFPLPSSSLTISNLSIPSHFPSLSKLDSYDSSMDEFIYKCKIRYEIPPMVFDNTLPSPILPPTDDATLNDFTFPELEWDDSISTEIRHRLPQQICDT